MRRRLWSEFLPASELADPATIALLTRYGVEPIIAVPPDAQTAELAAGLGALARGNVPFGLWPLMSDEDGYWPSETTATAFSRRVDDVLAFATQARATPRTIAVDLEPPLGVTRELLEGALLSRVGIITRELPRMYRSHRRRDRETAVAELAGLAQRLRANNIETLAAAIPPVILDLASGATFWQALFRTPATKPGWSVLSPMLYTSMIATGVPGGAASARAILFESARAFARSTPAPRASVSIGLVAPGKLGDEPHYDSPAELAADVALARAAGVDDLALFSLEGVLHRGSPEQWLDPFTRTEPSNDVQMNPAAGFAMRAALTSARIAGLAAKK